MPASEDIRVRVDDFSKIIASSLLASGRCSMPRCSCRLASIACAIGSRYSSPLKSSRLMKCLGTMSVIHECVDAGDQPFAKFSRQRGVEKMICGDSILRACP